jgi:4-amino-4-deoxy-L-arabinose transferase-like glycosyltransferase
MPANVAASTLAARAIAALPLAAILLLATLLRTWSLGENGFGRTYYAAAVKSQLASWHNLFFNAFDPAGFVSIDKPPVAIWLQTLSAKLIGFHGPAMLLPQVVEGLVAVVLVYLIVVRTFGRGASLLSALLLAITPIAVAADRSNNTESCLVVALLAAIWLGMRAAETGQLALLCGAMAALGIGFNIKMAAAWALAPVLLAAYLLAGGLRLELRRLLHVGVASLVLLGVSLSWVAAFDLVAPERRPYAGSTTGNSMLELVLQHNGLARFRQTREAGVSGSNSAATTKASAPDSLPPMWDTSPPGPLRLLRPLQAGQAGWWLPFAIAGAILGWALTGSMSETRARRIATGIWVGWVAAYWVPYSFAGGVFHTYYLAALGPPLAALAGIGAAELWRRWRHANGSALLLPGLVALTAIWQAYLVLGQTEPGAPRWLAWLLGGVLAVALAGAALASVGARPTARSAGHYKTPALAFALACLLVLPITAASSVVLLRPNVILPAADLAAYGRPQPDMARFAQRTAASREKLIGFLKSQHMGETFLVAVPNALIAAPLIMATGLPVMPIGGYAGIDPILGPRDLERLVASGRLRFLMTGGFTISRNSEPRQRPLVDWARVNGRPVDPALWRPGPATGAKVYHVPIGGRWVAMPVPELFDLRPPAGPAASR